MGIRAKITTKGFDEVKTTEDSDAVVEVPISFDSLESYRSIDIVDGTVSFNLVKSITISEPPAAGATGILPGITGSWLGRVYTVAKYGVNALTITASNAIKGTGSFTMTLTGSQYATIPGLGGQSLPAFNSATVARFLSAQSGSGYVWYVIS